jgi:hypothetical protein
VFTIAMRSVEVLDADVLAISLRLILISLLLMSKPHRRKPALNVAPNGHFLKYSAGLMASDWRHCYVGCVGLLWSRRMDFAGDAQRKRGRLEPLMLILLFLLLPLTIKVRK